MFNVLWNCIRSFLQNRCGNVVHFLSVMYVFHIINFILSLYWYKFRTFSIFFTDNLYKPRFFLYTTGSSAAHNVEFNRPFETYTALYSVFWNERYFVSIVICVIVKDFAYIPLVFVKGIYVRIYTVHLLSSVWSVLNRNCRCLVLDWVTVVLNCSSSTLSLSFIWPDPEID